MTELFQNQQLEETRKMMISSLLINADIAFIEPSKDLLGRYPVAASIELKMPGVVKNFVLAMQDEIFSGMITSRRIFGA